jgi:uncharacterized protein (DUF302 family)
MPQTQISRRTISVEHCVLMCARSFESVHQALTSKLPSIDPHLAQILSAPDKEAVAEARKSGPKLWLFLVRDHGALLAADDRRSKAIQYEIGNPLTAERMTRHRLAAALYAPLRVVLFEDDRGKVVFEYDRPSSLFGQFDDPEVLAIGRELDAELESVLASAAGA